MMRIPLPAAVMLVIAFALTAAGQEASSPPSVTLFPGTETPRIKQCPDGAAYVYKAYTIYVTQSGDFPGQDIVIYAPPSPPSDPCGQDKGGIYFSIPTGEFGGANYFAGISENYLFIDQGTGPSYRTVSIFDMKEKTFPLLAVRYSDARIEDGLFTYYETRDEVESALKKIPCPKAPEWRKQGLDIVYEEQMSFDLKTGRQSSLSRFRCSPVQ